MSYDSIRQQLEVNKAVKYHYRKQDGTKLVLCIYPSKDYGPDNAETVWVFEEDPN